MSAASLISDRSRELTRKTGGLKHTPAVGLDATSTTKIFQLFFFGVHFILPFTTTNKIYAPSNTAMIGIVTSDTMVEIATPIDADRLCLG